MLANYHSSMAIDNVSGSASGAFFRPPLPRVPLPPRTLTPSSPPASLSLPQDDGSAYYDTPHNVVISASEGAAYGGNSLKSDFGGHVRCCREEQHAPSACFSGRTRAPATPAPSLTSHVQDNFHHDNLDLFWSVGFGICSQVAGHGDAYYNNILYQAGDGNYGNGQTCSGAGLTYVANNTIYSPTGAIKECGTTLAQWQAAGNDPGSVAKPYPDDSVILAAARSILGM